MDRVKITHVGDDRFLLVPMPKPHLVTRFVNTGNTRSTEELRAELGRRGVSSDMIDSKLKEAKEGGTAVVDVDA